MVRTLSVQAAVTRWLPLIREHKPGIVAALKEATSEPLSNPAMEARRQRVLDMLAEWPGIRYALMTDTEAEAVIVALAIRGAMQGGSTVTCELRVPRAKYDPFLLLDLVERHGGTVH